MNEYSDKIAQVSHQVDTIQIEVNELGEAIRSNPTVPEDPHEQGQEPAEPGPPAEDIPLEE